jgi:hypothetical protein
MATVNRIGDSAAARSDEICRWQQDLAGAKAKPEVIMEAASETLAVESDWLPASELHRLLEEFDIAASNGAPRGHAVSIRVCCVP